MCISCGCRPLARSRVYEFLSVGFLYPDPSLVDFLASHLPEVEAYLQHLGEDESATRLGTFAESADNLSTEALQGEYLGVFGHAISKECPPYETDYGQAHIFQQSQTLADIAGFYSAFGLQLSPSFKDRQDHISAELEFMHFLTLKEAHATVKGHPEDKIALCQEAQRKFLDEHLGKWLPSFLSALKGKAASGPYRSLGKLTESFFTAEMERLSLKLRHGLQAPTGEVQPDEEDACLSCPLAEAIGGGIL